MPLVGVLLLVVGWVIAPENPSTASTAHVLVTAAVLLAGLSCWQHAGR